MKNNVAQKRNPILIVNTNANFPNKVNEEAFFSYAIYQNHPVFPGLFVAKRFIAKSGETFIDEQWHMESKNIDDLRLHFKQQGLTCFRAMEDDDPSIIETWL